MMTITVKIVLSLCSITIISQYGSESVLYYNSFPPICVQVGLLLALTFPLWKLKRKKKKINLKKKNFKITLTSQSKNENRGSYISALPVSVVSP